MKSNAVYAKVRERDQHRCQYPMTLDRRGDTWRKCGASQHTEAHHRQIRGQGGQDTEENLILLCKKHHDWCHANPVEAEELSLIVSCVNGEYDTTRPLWMEDQIPEDGYFDGDENPFD